MWAQILFGADNAINNQPCQKTRRHRRARFQGELTSYPPGICKLPAGMPQRMFLQRLKTAFNDLFAVTGHNYSVECNIGLVQQEECQLFGIKGLF